MANTLEAADGSFGLSDSELQQLADQIPNGSAAIFVIFEHDWARPLKEAMIRTGGYVRAQGIIDPDTLKTATNELAAVLAAVNKAEQATMEQMAKIMSGAKSQEEEALSRAGEAMAEADVAETEAEATLEEAARMAEEVEQAKAEAQAREEVARIIDPAATREALDAILAADVVDVSAARKAAQ